MLIQKKIKNKINLYKKISQFLMEMNGKSLVILIMKVSFRLLHQNIKKNKKCLNNKERKNNK